ncbi:HD domain-containing protein [Fischerella sp. PCC 9605]|uniref:HD domain-containing protein n=1 Tax=Fischerella sp. PCC 9605 TaxID=1173024 RepID=UPI0004B502B7|nr:HD domain-containing protein [Fischerella sp. PCC 9605]
MSASFNFTELSIPDSELAKKATQLVAEVSPKFLYNHCVRTYLFGEILGRRDALKFDRELLYLSAVMHDLGLTERFDGQQRFEVDSADAAQAFLLEHGLPQEKAEIVWDAIALHTSIGIASRKQPEIALVHLGAGVDAAGMRLQDIAPETVERVIDAYPRLGCGKALMELILSQVKRKPEAAAFTWMADVGRCHVHGFVCPSFGDAIRNSPFND